MYCVVTEWLCFHIQSSDGMDCTGGLYSQQIGEIILSIEEVITSEIAMNYNHIYTT